MISIQNNGILLGKEVSIMKENTKNARINVRAITFTAVMAALVFVFTYTFKIPFVNGYTHIGDSMIFLAIVFFRLEKSSACGRYRCSSR